MKQTFRTVWLFSTSFEINMIQFSASMSRRIVSTYLTGNIINIFNIFNNADQTAPLDIEDRSEELLTSALFCHKEPAQDMDAPHTSFLCMKDTYFACLEGGSLWQKRAGIATP